MDDSLGHCSMMIPTATSSTIGRASNTIKVGPYVLKKVIGRGNFAVVKLGKHEVTKAKVAIKIVDKSRIDDDNLRKIYREIQILKSLRHPNIVRLYQVMETESKLYLVTEFASGGEVFEYLQKNGRMNERQARRVFRQTVAAIAYCHMSGIVHRDLKAENLLLDAENNVKLVDFGFSNFYNSGQLLSTWCGSPPYAAPELFRGENYDGTKADVWSLGVVLYILVSGGFPFPSNSIERLKQAVLAGHINIPFYVSVECADLIRKMLVVDPAQRVSIRQVIQHKWFVSDDWTDRQQVLFNESLTPKLMGSQETNDLNPTVIVFMQQKGYNADTVTEAVLEKRFDEEYAVYHLLCDKLFCEKSRVRRLINDAALEAAGDLPRRGSRGSLTTGQVNIEPMMETNTILASDLVKLSMASLDQGSHTSDSDEGSSGEASPYNLHAYLSQRRHTALGVPGLSSGAGLGTGAFPAPPILSTASGHIGVPFPLAFGLGEVSNLANVGAASSHHHHHGGGMPNCLMPPLFRPDTGRGMSNYHNGRRGSDGAAGLGQQAFDFASAMSAAAFINPVAMAAAAMTMVPPPASSPYHRPASSGTSPGGTIAEESIEDAGARYLRVRASSKRHTIHGQLSTGLVGYPPQGPMAPPTMPMVPSMVFAGGYMPGGGVSGIGGGGYARQAGSGGGGGGGSGHHSSRHSSRGEPYRPLSAHRRASDSSNQQQQHQLNPTLLSHLERLYSQATQRPESPAAGEGMRQLQHEFQQLRANTELNQQQLLQSSTADQQQAQQPRRSPRSSPPGQSLDMIIEHDLETPSSGTGTASSSATSGAFGRSPLGTANQILATLNHDHLQQQQHSSPYLINIPGRTVSPSLGIAVAAPQINVTDERGTVIVHRPIAQQLHPQQQHQQSIVSPMGAATIVLPTSNHHVSGFAPSPSPPGGATVGAPGNETSGGSGGATDPITNFQYFAQGLLGSSTNGPPASILDQAMVNEQQILDNFILQQQLLAREFYQQTGGCGGGTTNYFPNQYVANHHQPIIDRSMDNNDQSSMTSMIDIDPIGGLHQQPSAIMEDSIVLPPNRTVSSIVQELKRALDLLKIAYTDVDLTSTDIDLSSDRSGDRSLEDGGGLIDIDSMDGCGSGKNRERDSSASRRVSLESEDGTKVEIGVARLMDREAVGFNKIDFRCVHGDYNRYKQLCREVLTALRW